LLTEIGTPFLVPFNHVAIQAQNQGWSSTLVPQHIASMVSKVGLGTAPYEQLAQSDTVDQKPRKVRRITRACDYCHKRSIKCRASEISGDTRCQNCFEFAQPCTYDRPVRRRGAKRRSPSSEPNGHQEQGTESAAFEGRNAGQQAGFTVYGHAYVSKSKGPEWRAPELASQATIMDLVEIYFEIVYPM
jgi:hypothetical protein